MLGVVSRNTRRTVSDRSFYELIRACVCIRNVCNKGARVMHIFHELGTFRDARESARAAPLRTYPLYHLRALVKRPYFLRLPHHERLAEASGVKIERLSSLSFPSREEGSVCFRNLTNFRSTSTSTSFSRERSLGLYAKWKTSDSSDDVLRCF